MKLLLLRLARVTTSRRWGVARVGAVLVAAVLVLLALIFVVPLTRRSQQPESVRRDACRGNLKQIALAFGMWASEHGDKFPMQLAEYQGGPKAQGVGKKQIAPVSPAFSNAFLVAILPQLSEYVRRGGFQVKTPISTNDLDMARYVCGVVDGDPMAFVYLKNGARFNYRHGQVIAFYAHDASRIPGDREGRIEDGFGRNNLSTAAAVSLARKTIKALGYPEKTLHLDESPEVVPPRLFGTNLFARYFLTWEDKDGIIFWATAEIDADSKTIKALFINDLADTNLWRQPPKISPPIAP